MVQETVTGLGGKTRAEETYTLHSNSTLRVRGPPNMISFVINGGSGLEALLHRKVLGQYTHMPHNI